MDFTERTPLEKGFAALFQEQVRPALMSLETERVERLGKARKWMLIIGGGGLGLAAAIAFGFPGDWSFFLALFIGILSVGGAIGARTVQATGWTGAVEEAVMPAVCAHVGDLTYTSDGGHGFPLGDMSSLGMLPSFTSSTLSDDLKGRHRGTDFELVEARLRKQTRDSDGKTKTRTVFGGLLLHIGVPSRVPTPILIARDYGSIGNTLGTLFSGGKRGGMPKVQFDHDAFESAFEVHAEDPQAARDFMPPHFLDILLSIGESEGGRKGAKSMVAGFRDQSFYLALRRSGDFLKMGSLTTPVADMEEDLHAIFADIELVHRIIDRLHGE